MREHLDALETSVSRERMLPDGRILECRRNPLPDGGLIVMYNDVSEQRHADYLVKEAARQLRFMLDRAPVALAMIGQEDGRLKHANARFHKLFGLPDQRPHEPSDLATHFTAEDRARILAARTGGAAVEFETSVRRADGSTFFALVAAVRYVFEWEPTSLVTFHDISDRRRAEAGLRKNCIVAGPSSRKRGGCSSSWCRRRCDWRSEPRRRGRCRAGAGQRGRRRSRRLFPRRATGWCSCSATSPIRAPARRCSWRAPIR